MMDASPSSVPRFDYGALKPDCGELPPFFQQRPIPHDILEKLERAASLGDLDATKAAFFALRVHPHGAPWTAKPAGALIAAVDNQHVHIVEYLVAEEKVSFDIYIPQLATLKKDTRVLEILLKNGWDINQPVDWFIPPLLMSAIEDEALTDWFLLHGADINAECALDQTPLSFAVQDAPFELLKRLFEKGGSIHQGQLLHHAVLRKGADRVEVLAYLIDHGLSVNQVQYENRLDSWEQRKFFWLGTPLQYAAAEGDLEVVRFLVDHGARPSIRDSRGHLPVERAESGGHAAVVDLLRSIGDAEEHPEDHMVHGIKLQGPICWWSR